MLALLAPAPVPFSSAEPLNFCPSKLTVELTTWKVPIGVWMGPVLKLTLQANLPPA